MKNISRRMIAVAAFAVCLCGGGWLGADAKAQTEEAQVSPAPVVKMDQFSDERPDLPLNHPYRQTYQQNFGQGSMGGGGGSFGNSSYGKPQINSFFGAEGRARQSDQDDRNREEYELNKKIQELKLKREVILN